LASGYPVLVPPEILQYFAFGYWLAVVGQGAGSACVVSAGDHLVGSCGLVKDFKQAGGDLLALLWVVLQHQGCVSDFCQDSGGVVKIALLVFAGEAAQRIECGLGCCFGVNNVLCEHGLGSSYSQRIQHRAAAACSHSVSVWQSYGIALFAAAAAITSKAAAVIVFSAVMVWAPVV
jgi:hypothetical protein